MAAMTQTLDPNKKSFSKWLRGRKGQQMLVMIAFMIIPLLLLFTFTYLPFGEMVGFSFQKMKYTGARKFVGWDNYINVFKSNFINLLNAKCKIYFRRLANETIQM